MHFDPRTQDALREVGLDTAQLREASDLVSAAVADDADRPLSDTTVELSLGPTVNDRVRFAELPDEL